MIKTALPHELCHVAGMWSEEMANVCAERVAASMTFDRAVFR